MKLKVKDMDVATGDSLVAVVNQKDASLLDLHPGDRIKIKKGKKIETVIMNLGVGKTSVPRGTIGLFEEALTSTKLKNKDTVEIIPARRPVSVEFIKKKLDGHTLSQKEIHQIVWDIVHNKLSNTEVTFFVAACYLNEMNEQETLHLTQEMVHHGDTLRFTKKPIMDKHCIGGVAGNRTTMVIVPIIAAAGLTIPKTSSRSITSPAGTADTMEVLSNVSISVKKITTLVKKTNGCMIWGGSLNLAPADDKIIRVERPLAIDAESQLLASVIAKKASAGATHVVIDIPYGKGSKVLDKSKALQLKRDFEKFTKKLGITTKVVLTDGRQPIGNGIGPALEARDVLWVLENDERAPQDLVKKSLKLAGILLEMGNKAKVGQGFKKAKELLESGIALKKMKQIIKAQGKKIDDSARIRTGSYTIDLKAKKSGTITHISNTYLAKIARIAGAPNDKGAGIFLHHHLNDKVKKKDVIYTIYTQNQRRMNYVKDVLKELNGVEIH